MTPPASSGYAGASSSRSARQDAAKQPRSVVPDVADIDRKVVAAGLEKYRLDGVVVTRVVDVARKTKCIPPNYTLGGWYGADP